MITEFLLKTCSLISVLMIVYIAPPVKAADLGVMGETYPIVEVDFLQFIQSRAREFQKSGQWQAIQQDMRHKADSYRERPQAVAGMSKAIETTSSLFDPSIVLDHAISTPDGRLIASAGTRVNPLTYINLSKTLIFFDGDDRDQVNWVIAKEKELQGKTKLILVNGSLLEQERNFNKPVYFDQLGKLTSFFGIHHVPALVSQEGVRLRIKEVRV